MTLSHTIHLNNYLTQFTNSSASFGPFEPCSYVYNGEPCSSYLAINLLTNVQDSTI